MYRNGLLSLIIALSSTNVIANSQDVIYKKDGSVLKGTLIEQDFENGRYEIQLMGGSVFVVQRDDIEKITKEAAPVSQTEQELDALAAESRAKLHKNEPVATSQYTPTATQQTAQALNQYSGYPAKPKEFKHSVRIGSMSKDLTDSQDDGISLSGINLAYQYNFDKNIAAYVEYNSGDFDSIIEDGDYYEYDYYYGEPDISFTGFEVSAMASTNNYEGWQFYAGLGLFRESWDIQGYSDTATGTVFTLGMGYSWKPAQLHLRISGHASDDYGVDDYGNDVSSSNIVLQLATNF